VIGTPPEGQLVTAAVQAGDRQEPAAGPAGRLAAVLRQHWLATALVTLGVVLRLMTQFAYRPALLYIDSVKYLYDSQGNDPEGYKAPLRAILAVANLNAVAAVQHVTGIVLAIVIYRLLLRRGVSRWLAALAMAPILLDAYQLQQEQTIMPTTLSEALLVAGFAVLLWRAKTTWRAVIVAGLIFGTSAIVWQAAEALVVPAAVYLLVAGGGWRLALGRAATIVVACAIPILAYCTGSYVFTGSFFLSHSGVTSLYGRTASAADCSTIRLSPAERGICPDARQQALGSDWLQFASPSPVQADYRTLPRAEVDTLITGFNRAVVTQQPVRVIDSYLRDVIKLYAVTRHTEPGDPPISRWQFQTSFPYLTPHATKSEVASVVRQFGGGQPTVWRPVASFLRSYQLDGGYTPGPLLLLCTLTGLAGSVVALMRRRLDQTTQQLALATFLFFVMGASILLVSDVFVFSWRYQLQALVTVVPAGALGLALLGRLVRNWGTATGAARPRHRPARRGSRSAAMFLTSVRSR
jgi:hypothetical protein